ncbi:MAG: class I SAM-dependent methyltransferase [Fibromonadales bacterium]|nr:class I SAM-dependent methyltransferase [Fibromonadales bacterium]
MNRDFDITVPAGLTSEVPTFNWLHGYEITEELLAKCSALYSKHYGLWSEHDPQKRIGNIKLSVSRIKKWVESKNAKIAYCENKDCELLGYAFCIQENITNIGYISWVTQLVVHKDYRNKDIAKRMLFYIWNFADHKCWGLLTANPYAVRALEKATRRRVYPARIQKNAEEVFAFGKENVSYLEDVTPPIVNNEASKINTKFFVNHSDVPEMMSKSSKDEAWLLGSLEEGWEWFAFTFSDQNTIPLSEKDIAEMLKISDQITQRAYSKMQFDSHKWAGKTDYEIDYIFKKIKVNSTDKILDVGCATGRHTARLTELGYKAYGIDYSQKLIDMAKKKYPDISFNVADFRNEKDTKDIGKFDLILLLYDVFGSFVSTEDDGKMIKQVYSHLNSNGFAVISVMNLQYILAKGVKSFSFKNEPDKIYEIPLSDAMSKTGEVFNVNNILLDAEEKIVYRREIFRDAKNPSQIPEELLVRDRRYLKAEIENMFKSHFEIVESKYVRVGDWESCGESDDCKEILLIIRKSLLEQ